MLCLRFTPVHVLALLMLRAAFSQRKSKARKFNWIFSKFHCFENVTLINSIKISRHQDRRISAGRPSYQIRTSRMHKLTSSQAHKLTSSQPLHQLCYWDGLSYLLAAVLQPTITPRSRQMKSWCLGLSSQTKARFEFCAYLVWLLRNFSG